MNHTIFIVLLLVAALLGCSGVAPGGRRCPEGINTLPMYGDSAKCPGQLEADSIFIVESDSIFGNRQAAVQYYIAKGWEYFYRQDLDMAMKRFNQSWLLDSSRAEVFWGFGNILGMKNEFGKSIRFLEKSIALDPGNERVYECLAISYGQLFYETKDEHLIAKCIDTWKTAVSLDSMQAKAYAGLAVAYFYAGQTDSARKYGSMADKIDSAALNDEARVMINPH